MKFSQLSEKPLLSLAEGAIVGTVKGCMLSPDKTKLSALKTEDGCVLAENVTVGESAVLVKSSEDLLAAIPADCVESPLYLDLYCSDGSLVGEIGDLEFDDKFRMLRFWVGETAFERNLMLSSGDNAVVVCSDEEQLRRTRRQLAAKKKEETPPVSDVGKVSSNFSYLIGRKVVMDVVNQRNEKIVRKNSVVTARTLEICREYGKLLTLAKNSRIVK